MPGFNDLAKKAPKISGGGFNAISKTAAPQISMPEIRSPDQMEQMMNEEKPAELPFGAIGWNPDGTANYGLGIQGWWNGITSRIYAPTKEYVGSETIERPASAWETVKRAEWEAFSQFLNALSIPQQALFKYGADRRSYEMYADLVNSSMPDIYEDNEFGNFLRLTTGLIPGISNLTTMYEKNRIANGTRQLPPGTFEKIQEANRIWNKTNVGTALFDTQVQAEYIRRVLAGEDPYKLVKEYEKPLANFIADVTLDPLNVFDGLGIAGKFLGKTDDLIVQGSKILPKLQQIAEKLKTAELTDDVLQEIDDAAKIVQRHVADLADNPEKIAGTLAEITQDSKRILMQDKVSQVILPMLKIAEGDAVKVHHWLMALTELGSNDVNKVREAIKILQDSNIAHLFLTENGIEAGRFLKIVLNGADSPIASGLSEVARTSDLKKYLTNVGDAIGAATKQIYPDINHIADKLDEIDKLVKAGATIPASLKPFQKYKISKTARYIARFHKSLQESWFGTRIGIKPINEFFSLAYLTSTGFAVRNYLNALVTSVFDLGPGALKDMLGIAGGPAKYMDDTFGVIPTFLSREFSAITTAPKPKSKLMKYLLFMREVGSKGEQFEGVAVAATAGKQFANKLLKEGAFIAKMDELRAAGFSEDSVKLLEKLIRKYNGQTYKALDEFSKQFGNGVIEHFREPEMIFSENLLHMINAFDPHLMDTIRDALKTGTLPEIIQNLDDIINTFIYKMRDGVDNIVPDLSHKSVTDILDILGSGHDQFVQIFAKKVAVRRDAERKLQLVADKILSKPEHRQAYTTFTRDLGDQISLSLATFSYEVQKAVKELGIGKISVDDVIKQVQTHPLLSKMPDYNFALDKNMSVDTVQGLLWDFYKMHADTVWANSLRQNMNYLEALVTTHKYKSKQAMNILNQAKIDFAIADVYINAVKWEDGKTFVNMPYYFFKNGMYEESLVGFAQHLDIFGQNIRLLDSAYKPIWLDEINAVVTKQGLPKIKPIVDEQSYRDGMEILTEYGRLTGKKILTPDDVITQIYDIPILDDGNVMTLAAAYRSNWAGFKRMMDSVKASVKLNYGRVEMVSDLAPDQLRQLTKWAMKNEAQMLDFRTNLMSHMKETRDFVMLDYAGGKRNIDLALAYLYPYQFWYSRSYNNWIKRLAANPAWITRYAKYREYLEKQNANLPEYMRNYVVLGKSFGFAENPVLLNLEASLNPLNGMTGVDFTDKNKIVGQPGTLEYMWTSTLDTIGKYGPTPWTPINTATAAYLAYTGEKEAAGRWAGRMLPQTQIIKALGSIANLNLEYDPFVALFGEGTGTDPYERRRVGRALIALVNSEKITKEQAYEAARTMRGDIWEQAVILSTKNRAFGTISAYTLGQGFKVRTPEEAEIDKFYEEYYKMWANANKFTPDEMANYQRYIRDKYPFADLVLLSTKGSQERDKAYAYAVLNRIGPGQTSEIFDALGIPSALSDQFYNDKGDMTKWQETDRIGFMNAMVQLGTLLKIPQNTTIQQWQEVKVLYKQVDRELQSRYGEDILNKIQTYYEFDYDKMKQDDYLVSNPDVKEAMDFRDYLIGSNKILAPYYDGLSRMERYYDGEFRRQVTENIDPNYYEYVKLRSLIIDPNELKRFEKEVNWKDISKRYNEFKAQWDLTIFKKLDEYDKYFIGEPIGSSVQEGVEVSLSQKAVINAIMPAVDDEKQVSWRQITSYIPMPTTLETAIQNYIQSDRPFTSAENSMVNRLLNNVNETYGTNYTKEDLLSLAMDYYR